MVWITRLTVAGYAAGVVWLAVCIWGVEIARRQRTPAPWQVGLERRRVARHAGEG